MVPNSPAASSSFIPPRPVPQGAELFSERVHGLLDGQPKDEATVSRALEGLDEMFERIAMGFYNLASMLVGEGEESVRLVEKAVATTDFSNCQDPQAACKSSRLALARAGLEIVSRRDPQSLTAPESVPASSTCIQDDELEAAGVSVEDLERMFAGPDRHRVREWLAQLPPALRTIFALRAVADFTTRETADLLVEHGGPAATGWTADSVREIFRQGLCSLASQLLHATATR